MRFLSSQSDPLRKNINREDIHMEKGSQVAIVCCSNGQKHSYKEKIEQLKNTVMALGLIPVCSDFIYEKESVFSGSGKERAEALMKYYQDDSIQAIFDISGGDIANEILPYLDYSVIGKSEKQFWGYSDLTTVINGIYAKTGKSSVLYQIRNLIYEDKEKQIQNFSETVLNGGNQLFSFDYELIQGQELNGIVVGGNIRCLLKLAGTPYWPCMQDKILLLEARSGTLPQMVTYFNQLKQMGVFEMIKGIILGTFTEMEKTNDSPAISELVKSFVGKHIPIVKTQEIGHGADAKGIVIGGEIHLKAKH